MRWGWAVAVVTFVAAVPIAAQDDGGKSSSAAPMNDEEWRNWAPASAEIEMPELAFEESAETIKNYEKYYYFNRPDTSFEEALSDLRQCDGFSRGLYGGDYYPNASMTAMYGLGGVIGGAIGGAIANAIYGSAEERRKRRVNMRRCMFFKGYERYGLSKELRVKFNFEEGNSDVPEKERQQMLAQQAKVAAGSKPQAEGLGL